MNKTPLDEHALLGPIIAGLSISKEVVLGLARRHPAVSRNLIYVVAAGLVVAAVNSIGIVETVLPTVLPNCSVGYLGTAANVRFSGFGADAECRNLEAIDPGFVPTATGGLVLCHVQLGGIAATVRDRGSFTYTGSAICAYLQRRAGSLS